MLLRQVIMYANVNRFAVVSKRQPHPVVVYVIRVFNVAALMLL
jgi:hypothetical protein